MTNNDEIKELKRQYQTIDNQITTKVNNLKKLLDTVPIEYIDLPNIATDIRILINQRDRIKSEIIANKAF